MVADRTVFRLPLKVTELVEQQLQFHAAAMHVANDIERSVITPAVAPQWLSG